MVFEEKTFENSTHVLDDNHYKACEFRNCTIIYRGGLLRLDQCKINLLIPSLICCCCDVLGQNGSR
jgi:hypothetical protein